MFDIAKFKAGDDERPVDLPIEYPNGEPIIGTDGKPVVLQVVSIDDPRYKRVQRRVIDERIAKSQRKRGNKAMTAAELEQEAVRLVAAAIVGWTPNMQNDGQPFPYTAENAEALCRGLPFVQEQVDAAINDRERFFKG
jgi:hypothetical protein